MPPRREIILYQSYVRMSWRGRGLMLRILPTGWTAGLVSLCLLFLGADPTRSLAYQLFGMMFALIGAATFSNMNFHPKAEARRLVPSSGVPGTPIVVEIEVRNTGKHRWRSVRLMEVPPLPVPSRDEFLATPEPDEKRRNIFDRTFIFYRFSWLGERRKTYHATTSAPFDLAPGAKHTVRLEIMPLRRGVLDFRDLRLVRDDVFGFFRRLRAVSAAPCRVIVMPRPAITPAMPSAGAASRPSPSGQSPWHRAGQSDEFLTLREYRPGDPLHHIHWAAFARAGFPVVREFEDVFQPRTALILDCLLPEHGNAFTLTKTFETAIEAAAALAGSLQNGETLLELLLVQDKAHQFTAGPGNLQARRLLEVLAAVQPRNDGSLMALERLALLHAARCGSAHFIGLCWDDERLRFLTRLQARGLPVTALIVQPDKPAKKRAKSAAPDVPANVPHWVKLLTVSEAVRYRNALVHPIEKQGKDAPAA